MRCLIWFREDLRIVDNIALHHATQKATDGVTGLYVISPQMWKQHDIAPARVDFMLRNLKALAADLAKLNIPLLIREAKNFQQIPKLLLDTTQATHSDIVFYNQQYEIDEMRRDMETEKLLEKNSIKVFSYHDQTILPPETVLTANNTYYTVFTPFKNTWLKKLAQKKITVLTAPSKQVKNNIKSDLIQEKITDFNSNIPAKLWPAGEQQAQARLKKFITNNISEYQRNRDFPAIDGTSTLSPYLAAGIISPRLCLNNALEKNHFKLTSGNIGITTWINELIWRDFYKHILYGFPRVSMHQPFKLNTDKLKWNNDLELFTAWKNGQTGYPIVDAAMRQLNATGWMHNRLRMIVAMFLTKNLWIDWRWGEKYFMQNLIDGDLAANNGGWQWAASTGTDAAPYFRIFNPITQSEKFDPQGTFIRTYCPELAKLNNREIHNPAPLFRKELGYPQPIIDHTTTRKHAIAAFKAVLK